MKQHWWLVSYKDTTPSSVVTTSEKRFTSTDLSKPMYSVAAVSYLGHMSEDTYYKGFDMREMVE